MNSVGSDWMEKGLADVRKNYEGLQKKLLGREYIYSIEELPSAFGASLAP